MKNDESDSKKIHKELVLGSLQFPIILLLYMTEDIQKYNDFYQTVVKINNMAIARNVLMFVIKK